MPLSLTVCPEVECSPNLPVCTRASEHAEKRQERAARSVYGKVDSGEGRRDARGVAMVVGKSQSRITRMT